MTEPHHDSWCIMTGSSRWLTYHAKQTPKQPQPDHHLLHLSFLHLTKRREGHMASEQNNRGRPRNKAFQRRGQRLLQLEGFSPLIDGRGAKLTPIQIVDPRKIGSYPENFGQLKRQDINCCSPMISIIMAPRSKRMPITNFEKSGQPIHQLSASSAIFTSL